jgi:hypothetical protein
MCGGRAHQAVGVSIQLLPSTRYSQSRQEPSHHRPAVHQAIHSLPPKHTTRLYIVTASTHAVSIQYSNVSIMQLTVTVVS